MNTATNNSRPAFLNPLFALVRRVLPEAHQRRYLCRALVMALVLRLALLGLIYMLDRSLQQHQHGLAAMIEEALTRWDGRHYMRLADQGYVAEGEHRFLIVFFPFLPFLIRQLNAVVHNFLYSGLLISFLTAVAAGYLLQVLLRREGFDEEHVYRAFMFYALLPMAIYTVAPFTEGLFLCLTLWSFLAARQQHWFRAGLAGALASATRSTGVLLLPALALGALWERFRRPAAPAAAAPEPDELSSTVPEDAALPPVEKAVSPFALLWLGLIPLGLLVYLYLNWKTTGDALIFMRYQSEHWNQGFVTPWQQVQGTLWRLGHELPGRVRFNYYEPRLLTIILGPILLIGGRRLPLAWQLYAWMSFLLFVCAREAISLPRYLYVLFPIYPVLAGWTRHPLVFQASLALSSILLAGWFVLFMTGSGAM